MFKALSDAPFFASCIEGVRDLTGDRRHPLRCGVGNPHCLYALQLQSRQCEMSRVTPPEEIEAKVEGTPMGMVGRLTATATTRLADADGGTVIRYSIDATLTGKLGSMGQPVLKAKAKEMEKQFSARLAAAFAGEQPGSPR